MPKPLDPNVLARTPKEQRWRTFTDVQEKPEAKIEYPRMYNVVLLNDDFTPMEFVILVLKKIFRKEHQEAEMIMLEVHKKGSGIAGTYNFEIAETKLMETLQLAKAEQHPLQAVLQRV